MDNFFDVISVISLAGIGYYTIWLSILIVNSFKDPRFNNDFSKIDPNIQLFVLIPVLNEADVIKCTLGRLIENTKNLPQIHFGVIDDASDDGTGKLIQEFIAENYCNNKMSLIQRKFPNAQTGKGDSLNYGINFIRSNFRINDKLSVVGVLDADAVMKEDDFKKVLLQFSQDHDLALLQTKVRMLNIGNWLQRMQDIEFATINDWIQRVRNKINNAAASGNGQFVHMAAVAGDNTPWGNALLEDFEFSTKFLLAGKKTLYRTDITVYQEAVNKVEPFIRQRSRWVQGGLDCVFSYLKSILFSSELCFGAKFEMIFFMFLPFMTCIVGSVNFIVLVFAFLNIQIFKYLIVVLIIINFILATYMAVKYCSDDLDCKVNLRIIWDCGGMAIYNIILFPAILIAFYRKVTGNQGWIKTVHGVNN